MVQKSSACRTTQFEPLTNSIGAALAEIRRIPFHSYLRERDCASHFESLQWSRNEKYGTNGSFLRKSDTALSFPLVSEQSDDEFPLKIAAEVKNIRFLAKTGKLCPRITRPESNRFC